MFKMLKVKQRQEHIPLVSNNDGTQATNQEDNKRTIHELEAQQLQEGYQHPHR